MHRSSYIYNGQVAPLLILSVYKTLRYFRNIKLQNIKCPNEEDRV